MPMELAVTYSNGITGSNTKSEREDTSAVIEFDHEVYIPVDSQTGEIVGTRVHNAVEFLKPMDKATPLLYKACCNGETLDELKFDWYEIKEGAEQVYFTTTLTNVVVTSVNSVLPNSKDPAKETQVHLDKVRCRYGDIQWEFVDGGVVHIDSWTGS